MSCGAALAHLCVALRGLGHDAEVSTFPDPGDADLLAIVGAGGRHTPDAGDRELFQAIETRRTHRAEFAAGPVAPRSLALLRTEAESAGADLTVVTGEQRQDIVTLVGEGDRVQFGDSAFRRELAAWMRPNHTRRRDGIRGDVVGLGAVTSLVAPTIVAAFDTGGRQATKDQRLAQASPGLLVLSTAGDAPADWLSAGQAVALLLLRATAEGLGASFLNQPVEVPVLRDRLRTRLGGDTHPQLLLRVGRASTGAGSLRRPVADVLAQGDR